jgi:hypothetical protein
MDDARIREFEESLWTGPPENYEQKIDPDCVMALPEPPFVLHGRDAIEAVKDTPRWSQVELNNLEIARPQEGLIVIAYNAVAKRDGQDAYEAHCTSTYRRLGPDAWRVVQHQQTPRLAGLA